MRNHLTIEPPEPRAARRLPTGAPVAPRKTTHFCTKKLGPLRACKTTATRALAAWAAAAFLAFSAATAARAEGFPPSNAPPRDVDPVRLRKVAQSVEDDLNGQPERLR